MKQIQTKYIEHENKGLPDTGVALCCAGGFGVTIALPLADLPVYVCRVGELADPSVIA